jgi:hypothetical protein
MISQVIQYKNLDEKFKSILGQNDIDDNRFVYLIKDKAGNVKSLTTSVAAAIRKVQEV